MQLRRSRTIETDFQYQNDEPPISNKHLKKRTAVHFSLQSSTIFDSEIKTIQSTSQKQKQRSCDNMQLDHCSAMQNICYVLGLYHLWIQTRRDISKKENDGIYDRIHNTNSKIKNRTHILNDFHHILDEHTTSNRDLETVQNYIQNTASCGPCIINKDKASCNIIARQLRDTTKEQHNRAVKARHFCGYTDKKEIVTQQILDTIHSFMYHSFDTLRFTVEEQREIDSLCTKRDTGDEIFYEAEAIAKAQSIIAKKKKMIGLICEHDPYKANKFSSNVIDIKHDDDDTEDMNENKVNTLMSVYSFGKQFIYHKTKDEFASTFHLLIKARYNNFKDELLNNVIHRVSNSNYNDTFEKALIAFDTDKAKKMKRRKDNDDYIDSVGDYISIHHILSILFYTDYSGLCFKFSQTYRRRTSSEKWSEVARRHSEYYHWGLLLKESVECFGVLAKGNNSRLRKKNTFFHGLNQELAFTTFIASFYGPTSFTDELAIAQTFAADDGIILSLQPHRKYPSLYFDCKWLSMHPTESEKLFIGGQNPLNIYTIITVSHPQTNHRKCLVAMMHISQMIGVESKDIKLKFKAEHQHYVQILIENELKIKLNTEMCNKYMMDSFHIFCDSVENVFIDLKHILFDKMATMFKNDDGVPKIQIFKSLFPNAMAFNVNAADSSKTHLLRVLSQNMEFEQFDNGILCLSPLSQQEDECLDEITAELMALVAVYCDDEMDPIVDMNEMEKEEEIKKLNEWYHNDIENDEYIIKENDCEKYLEELREKYIDTNTGLGRPNGYCKDGKKCGWHYVEEDVFPTLTLNQKLHGFFYHNEECIEYEANARSQKYCETHFKKGIRKSLLPIQTQLPLLMHSPSIDEPPILQKHASSIPYSHQIYDKPDVEYVSTMEEMAPTQYDTLQFGHPWEVEMFDATFGDPKQEILENAFFKLEKYHWNDLLKQSMRISKKREAKLIGLNLKLVVALKLYTDCDKLQDEFILSYRHFCRAQRIKRQKSFCYWNRLLEESCYRSQDIITDKLYRGVNQQVTTSSFTGTFWGPVSCTTEFGLANGFVGNEGTILQMYPTYSRRGLKVHWLSMFPYEKEVIYFNTSFQISHIYYKTCTKGKGFRFSVVGGSDFMERAILKSLQLINTESNVISFSDINDDANDYEGIASGFNRLDGSEKIAVLYLLYLQYRSNEWKQFWKKLDENIKFAFAKYRDQFISLAMNVRAVKMEKLSMWLQDFFCCDQEQYVFPIKGSTKQDIDNAKVSVEHNFIPYRPLNFGTIVRLFPNAQQLSINADNFDWTLQSFVQFVDKYQLDYQNIALQDIHIKFIHQYPYNDHDDVDKSRSPSVSSNYSHQISSVSTFEDIEASKRLNKHKDKSRKNIHELIKMGWKLLSPSHITRIGFEPLPEMPFVMTFVKNDHMYYRTYSQLLLNKEAFLTMNCESTTPILNSMSSYYDDEGGLSSPSSPKFDDLEWAQQPPGLLNRASSYYRINSPKINITFFEKEEKEGAVRDRGSSVVVDYNPINCTLSSQVLSNLSYKKELIQQLILKKKHKEMTKSNNKLKQSFNKYCNMVKALVLDPMPSELQAIFMNNKSPSFEAILSVFPNVCDLFLRDTQLKLKICYGLETYLKQNKNCKLERIFFCKEANRCLHKHHQDMVRERLAQLDWDLNVIEQMIFCTQTLSPTINSI